MGVTLFSLAVFAAASAFGQGAPTRWTYPGSVWHAVSGGSYGIFAGSVYNGSSTGDINVICPLRQHSLGVGSTIKVYDRGATHVTCTICVDTVTSSGLFQPANHKQQ